MRIRRSLAAAVVAATALGCRRHPVAALDTSVDAAADTLLVHRDEIAYRGQRLVLQAPLADWVRVLGPPDRAVDRSGGLRIWDSLGLVANLSWHRREDDPCVDALWVAMAPAPYDFWPTTLFRDSAVVDVVARQETAVTARYRLHADMKDSDIPEATLRGRSVRLNPLVYFRLTSDRRLGFLLVRDEKYR